VYTGHATLKKVGHSGHLQGRLGNDRSADSHDATHSSEKMVGQEGRNYWTHIFRPRSSSQSANTSRPVTSPGLPLTPRRRVASSTVTRCF